MLYLLELWKFAKLLKLLKGSVTLLKVHRFYLFLVSHIVYSMQRVLTVLFNRFCDVTEVPKSLLTKNHFIMGFKYHNLLKVDEFCTLFWPLTFLSQGKTSNLAPLFSMKEEKMTVGNLGLSTLGHPF